MSEELLAVLEHIERERGVDKELLFKAIESALVSAARKIIGKKDAEVSVNIDRASGKISIFSEGKEISSDEFGRIAAQTAKQVIIQKIREAERDVILDEFQKRINTVISGSVHRFERGDIIVDLGKTEGILPKSQQVPKERYKQGDRIRAFVLEVTKTPHGPQIVLSRSSANFVKKLFELEVPEITEGIVEIKSISREAGERTKIAVLSKEEKIDPVGACVGIRGSRVKDIVRELQGERVDIIRWNDDIKEYAKAALSPAAVVGMKFNKESKKIEITTKDDQLAIAIGKHGQNVRLASRLIGWEIDIRGAEEKKGPVKGEETKVKSKPQEIKIFEEKSLMNLDGIGPKIRKALEEAGLDTVEKVKKLKLDELLKLPGVGKKTAEKIFNSAKKL